MQAIDKNPLQSICSKYLTSLLILEGQTGFSFTCQVEHRTLKDGR